MSIERDLAASTLGAIRAQKDEDNSGDINYIMNTERLASRTAAAVLAAVAKALAQGRELDELQAEFKWIGDEIKALPSDGWTPRYTALIEREQAVAARIDALRRALGMLS